MLIQRNRGCHGCSTPQHVVAVIRRPLVNRAQAGSAGMQ
jgi:hypothetical protein